MIIKYKKHYYGDSISNKTVELPDDTVFIFKDGDVGQMKCDGFNHYLAATKSKIELNDESLGFSIYNEFPDITFIQFNNVVFESEIPIISGEEFYKRFELDTYYIFRSTRENFRTEFGKDGTISIVNRISSKPISVTKILSIDGPYRLNIITAYINSWLSDKEFLSINTEEFVSLMNLTNNFHLNVEIKRNCEEEFIEYINKTLKLVNYKVVYDQPSH